MDVQAWTYIIVGITFMLYIGIAIWSKANSTNEFYIAGKGVSPLANGMATAADWMSAASFLSMAGIIAFSVENGILVVILMKEVLIILTPYYQVLLLIMITINLLRLILTHLFHKMEREYYGQRESIRLIFIQKR